MSLPVVVIARVLPAAGLERLEGRCEVRSGGLHFVISDWQSGEFGHDSDHQRTRPSAVPPHANPGCLVINPRRHNYYKNVMELSGEKPRLLPWVPVVVKKVDLPERRIEVEWGADW